MKFNFKKIGLTVLSVLFAFMLVGMFSFTNKASAAEKTTMADHLIYAQSFDGLTEEEFVNTFAFLGDPAMGSVSLEAGGVSDGGKVLKIDRWAAALTEVDFSNVEELTISAWVKAVSSENRLFGVKYQNSNYYLKGGAISNDDHSVVAWSNTLGAAVVNNDPDFSGIYEKNGEGFYALTITVTRDVIKFYKNNLLIDSYYTCNDRETGDVKKFINAFYEGLKNNQIIFGGGSFYEEYAKDYYIDDIRIYDYAVESYNDFYTVLSAGKNNLSAKYSAIVDNAAIQPITSEKAPILYYDFSSVEGGVIENKGSKANGNATVEGSCQIVDGEIVFDGNGYIKLPDYALDTADGEFTVSMEVKRATTWSQDMFYYFAEKVDATQAPSGYCWVDSWFKAKSDEAVPQDISWIITDYCDNAGVNPHWNYVLTTPDLNEFTITNVYKDGKLRCYVNGFMLSEQVITDGIDLDKLQHGYIGRGFWDRNNFYGAMDNFVVYDYALEPASIVSIANRAEICIDFPENATEDFDVANYTYFRFDRFEDLSFKQSVSLAGLDIDFNEKEAQIINLREGVIVRVYFREILPLTQDIVCSVKDELPIEVEVSYSDGTTELLSVTWDSPYVFGGESTYTGTAEDSVGRTAQVTFNVSYRGDKADLVAMTEEVAAVLDFEPLFEKDAYNAYKTAILTAYEQAVEVKNNSSASNQDVLDSLVALRAALQKTEKPVRALSLTAYTLDVNFTGEDISVSVKALREDTVKLSAFGLAVKVYDSSSNFNEISSTAIVDAGSYKLVLVRKTAASWNTAILDVYLVKGDVIVASVVGAVSENSGTCSIENSTATDISLLSFYTDVKEKEYTSASYQEYKSILEENNVGQAVADWIDLTAEQAKEKSLVAKSAYEKLVFTKIVSVTSPKDIVCNVGTDISSLIPKTVTVTFDNGSQALLRVEWNLSSFNSANAGEHVLKGTVAEKDGTPYNVEMKIKVNGESNDEKPKKGCKSTLDGNLGAFVLFTICASAVVLKKLKRKTI